jgi:Leucine-rich repeat (LRR) protein
MSISSNSSLFHSIALEQASLPLTPEPATPLTPVSGLLTPASSSSDDSDRGSVTPQSADARSDRDTPSPALVAHNVEKAALLLRGNCEAVNSILKKRAYLLPEHPQTEEEHALVQVAKTIFELRIEACTLSEEINVQDIDRDPESASLSERVKSGDLCEQINLRKLNKLAAFFPNVKKLKIYFAKLASIHMRGLTAFKELQHLDLRFCQVRESTNFAPLKKLKKLETAELSHGYNIPATINSKFNYFAQFLEFREELRGSGQRVSSVLKDASYVMDAVPDSYLDAINEIAPTIRELSLEGLYLFEISEDDVPLVAGYGLQEGDIVDVRMQPTIGLRLGLISLEKNTLRGHLEPDRISELSETFKNVSKIELSITEIDREHLIALNNFPGLQVLEFRSCTFKNPEALQCLAEMKSLRAVKFLYCEGINNLALRELKQALQLTSLEISSLFVEVTKEGVKYPISDSGISYLFNLSKLEYLDLSNSAISDGSLFKMGQAFKQLKVLILKDCPIITKAGVDAITRDLPGLQRLDTAGCRGLRPAMSLGCAPITRVEKPEEKKAS